MLRGLHYHRKQADLWAVPSGHVRAALYDFRASSPTYGVSQVIEMGQSHPVGLYIPKGVAHGFYALADSFMTYLVDEYYDNTDELGILWNDPALGLDWGAVEPDPVRARSGEPGDRGDPGRPAPAVDDRSLLPENFRHGNFDVRERERRQRLSGGTA